MKKLYFLLPALLLFCGAHAQIIFSEDFDGIPGPTAGGAGTYVFPAGWLLRNVDNRTPDAQVAYVNEAWERREDFGHNVVDSCAFSTSWYNPAGAADDWMWTPLIGPLPANATLSWNAIAYDPMYLDGYEVRIMTAASGPPTGGTGTLGNQVSNSTVIFSTTAEASSWTAHTVNLSAYAGQSVYISWRNNSNDKFLLCIDDVVVQQIVNYDAQMLSVNQWEYSQVPVPQATMPQGATVRNNGLNAITGVTAYAAIYDQSNTLLNTYSGTYPSLASGATNAYTFAPYTLPAPGSYRVQYSVSINESDQVPANDMLVSDTTIVSDSVYARDRGGSVGTLGIGAGNGGYIGQQFVLLNADQLTSLSLYLSPDYSSFHVSAAVFAYNNGVPTTMIAHCDTVQLTSGPAAWFTFPLSGGPLTLAADTFVVVAVEVDSTVTLGQTTEIFNNNTTWVNWPTNPLNRWAHLEEFGSSFARTQMIRANFGDVCANFSASTAPTDATCGNCGDGSATVSPVAGYAPFTYLWSSGGTSATESNLSPGNYSVTVTDAFGCITTATVTVGNNCTSFGASLSSTAATCGTCNDGSATASVTNGTGSLTILWSNGDTTLTSTNLLPGTYTVTITDSSGCMFTDTVNVTFTTGIATTGAGSVEIFPNPSNGNFTISIINEKPGDVDVEVYNALGERILSEHHEAFQNGKLALHLDKAGVYTVKVRTENGVSTTPLLVK